MDYIILELKSVFFTVIFYIIFTFADSRFKLKEEIKARVSNPITYFILILGSHMLLLFILLKFGVEISYRSLSDDVFFASLLYFIIPDKNRKNNPKD